MLNMPIIKIMLWSCSWDPQLVRLLGIIRMFRRRCSFNLQYLFVLNPNNKRNF